MTETDLPVCDDCGQTWNHTIYCTFCIDPASWRGRGCVSCGGRWFHQPACAAVPNAPQPLIRIGQWSS